jgi:hypothetical protein
MSKFEWYHDNIRYIILYLRPRAWVILKVHKNLLLFFQNQNIYLTNFLSMLFNKFIVLKNSMLSDF